MWAVISNDSIIGKYYSKEAAFKLYKQEVELSKQSGEDSEIFLVKIKLSSLVSGGFSNTSKY